MSCALGDLLNSSGFQQRRSGGTDGGPTGASRGVLLRPLQDLHSEPKNGRNADEAACLSSTELFSHSTMFVKQGGLHVLPPLQLLARNHGSENTWLQLVIPSNVGNELLYSAIVGSSHVGA